MRIFGLLLLFSGWVLVLAALPLLRTGVALSLFVLAGVSVEVLGATLMTRFHMEQQKARRG